MSRNAKGYKEWTVGNRDYKLVFIPSDVTDLSSPTSYEFPPDVVISNLTIESGYDDDIAIGLPLADIMNFEIDIKGFNTAFYTDFTQYIIEGNSGATRTVNGESVTIPNQWRLYARDTGDASYDEELFYGCQDIKPTIEYKIEDGHVRLSITAVSLVRSAMERVSIGQIAPSSSINARKTIDDLALLPQDRLFDYYYNYNSTFNEGLSIYSKILDGEILTLSSLADLKTSIQTAVSTMVGALSRESFTFTMDDLISNIDFRSPDIGETTNNEDLPYSSIPRTQSQLYYIAYVEHADDSEQTFYAGLFSENTKDPSFYEYPSVWDLLKALLEGTGSKWSFENTSSNIALEEADLLGSQGKVLDNDLAYTEIAKGFELTKGTNLLNEVRLVYKDNGSEDIEDLSQTGDWTQGEDSYEIELLFHNTYMNYEDDDEAKQILRTGSDWRGQYRKSGLSYRTLYVQKTIEGVNSWIKVAGQCTLTVGNQTFTSGSGSEAFDPLYTDAGLKDSFVSEVNNRQQNDTVAEVLGQGIQHVYGNKDQGQLKCTVDITKVNHTYLGEFFKLDIDTLADGYSLGFVDYTTLYPAANLIITSVVSDYISNKSEVTFFIRAV